MTRLLALILILLAGVAQATPGRMTTSDDRLIAATQTHFYVLRDTADNLGSYYLALHDQHLVEIDIETGDATRYWPLRLMKISHLETDEYLYPGDVTERPGETHDMITVLRDLGAQPIRPDVWAVQDLVLKDGALVRASGEQLFTPFGIRAAGRAQLGILRQEYPPVETEAAYLQATQIDFYNLYAEGDWDCVLRPEGQRFHRTENRALLVKLECEDYDLSGTWSFHIIIFEDHAN